MTLTVEHLLWGNDGICYHGFDDLSIPFCLNRGFDGLNGGHGGRQGNLTQGRNRRRRENGKVESVGVGSPNPLGGGTPPLRLRTYRSPAIRFCL